MTRKLKTKRHTKKVADDMRRSLGDPELRGLIVFSAVILMVGTFFYMAVEKWDFMQSLYFCVTTLTTVGFGDMHPTSDLSRAFTIVFVLVGVGVILGLVSVVARKTARSAAGHLERRERHIEKEVEEELRVLESPASASGRKPKE